MKKLLALLLVVATLFCIVACGDNTDTTTTTAGDTTTTTAQDDNTTTTVDDDNTTTTVDDDNTTTTVEDDNTTTTVKDETTTTTKKEETTKVSGLKGVDPNNSSNWMKVVNGVFTSDKGGLQIMAEGWKTYGLSNISYVPEGYNNQGVTNAVCIKVYDADPADVFAAKTQADFEAVLMTGINTFEPTTVCGYPAYKAVVTDAYYVWVVNTPTYKYFINFMQAPLGEGGYPFAADAASYMNTVVIYK